MTRASVNYRYCGFVLPSRCLRAMDRTGDSFVCEAVYHIDCRLYACTYHAHAARPTVAETADKSGIVICPTTASVAAAACSPCCLAAI